MNTLKAAALLMSLAAGMAATASASLVVLSNDFTTGVAGWVAETGMSITTSDDTGGIGTGNALKITSISSNRRTSSLLSQAVTLGVNDTISLTADYRYLNGPTTQNASLDIRFSDSATGNYMGFALNPSSSAAQTLVFSRTADTNEGKVNSFNHGTAKQSMTFTVGQILTSGNSQADFDLAWAEGLTYTDRGRTSTVLSPSTEFKFNTISLGVMGGATTDGLLFDNIVVTTTIPEPATLTLVGTVCIALFFLRRFRM